MTVRSFVFLSVCALAVVACRNSSGNTADAPAQPLESASALPAGFEEFYRKFLTDSVYQVAHITWPLQGLRTVNQDSTLGTRPGSWQPAEWRMQRLEVVENSSDFKREFQPVGDILVIERVRVRAANFGIERRYSKQANGEWELIYFADLHEIN
jgi:hypothetical protein